MVAPRRNIRFLLSGAAGAIALSVSAGAFAVGTTDVDASAAVKLAKKSNCLRCHGIEKKKEGPSYAFLAARYEGKPDAEEKLFKHITSGNLVKLTDGHKENHKVVRSMDPDEIRNLVKWILAQGQDD